MEEKEDIQWLVFREDFNGRKIVYFDIFNHSYFLEDIRKLIRSIDSREKFLEEVRNKLRYYFWSKCEYEVIISGWPPPREDSGFKNRKVDIYEQVMMNWDAFSFYIWEYRWELLRKRKGER